MKKRAKAPTAKKVVYVRKTQLVSFENEKGQIMTKRMEPKVKPGGKAATKKQSHKRFAGVPGRNNNF